MDGNTHKKGDPQSIRHINLRTKTHTPPLSTTLLHSDMQAALSHVPIALSTQPFAWSVLICYSIHVVMTPWKATTKLLPNGSSRCRSRMTWGKDAVIIA